MSKRLSAKIAIGVTGASGSVLAQVLVGELLQIVERVYIVATESGRKVCEFELGNSTHNEFSLVQCLKGEVTEKYRQQLRIFGTEDLFAPIASGSSVPDAMVVVPCSMGTLARIATGQSTNLLERAADVVLKQRRRLIISPRETPLSIIHLRNMVSLTEAGAIMVPPMPGFYTKPKSVEDVVSFCVGRIIEALDLPHELYPRWNPRMS